MSLICFPTSQYRAGEWLRHVDLHLAKWITRKYKRVHGSLAQAYEWLGRIRSIKPSLFAHWEICTRRERSTTRTG